ncbi:MULTISPECIES: hypothetical protein [unclassified Leptolyngbya]|uniref:hypothetical protein n=1 Tax=unclassified Leptolyngbya TaxID=2650499 RepID=UPI001688BEB8|nr:MULTISPECIES: hypothetical protein [unclassified Leptolyngbya]MBD1909290.1 hypothetical protein [Leptolyngbya sp. FACHB-8]MBD2153520.1 hypothetical protein [Leptolyngbya sp. FACHB-16]
MKVNSTVALTLILLALMVGAGVVSAAWGYSMGREALKGVTQPDVRPTTVGEEGGNTAKSKAFEIIPESKILEEVKTQMQSSAQGAEASVSHLPV